MVQIIDSPKSFEESFSQGLAGSLPDALGKLIERKRAEGQMAEEDEALSAQGIELKGIKNPKLREKLLTGHQETKKKEAEGVEDKNRMQTISKYFGKDAGQLYGELTEGGKTKFFESLLHNTIERKIPVNEFLTQFMMENSGDFKQGEEGQMPQSGEQQMPGMGQPQQPQQPREVDPDAGLSRPEITARQEKRYEKNLPLYEEVDAKLSGLNNEQETIDILEELNETKKLPQGLGRLNVNYKEGNLLVPAAANAETQRYVKTVNQFLNKAKDTFGARVTNFELDRFLQQLPTLANTEEGRREILKQMRYFNNIERTYQNELQNYIKEKGGIRNVDWDVAKRSARDRAQPKIKQFKDDFKNSEKIAKDLYDTKVKDVRSKTPKGKVAVEKDGQFGYIEKKNLFKATKNGGYKRL